MSIIYIYHIYTFDFSQIALYYCIFEALSNTKLGRLQKLYKYFTYIYCSTPSTCNTRRIYYIFTARIYAWYICSIFSLYLLLCFCFFFAEQVKRACQIKFTEQRRVREAPINWAAIKTRCEWLSWSFVELIGGEREKERESPQKSERYCERQRVKQRATDRLEEGSRSCSRIVQWKSVSILKVFFI